MQQIRKHSSQPVRFSSLETGLAEYLLRLEESREYLGRHLTAIDAMRLISAGLDDILPLERVTIFVLDGTRQDLQPFGSVPDSDEVPDVLARECFTGQATVLAADVAATPLFREVNIFG